MGALPLPLVQFPPTPRRRCSALLLAAACRRDRKRAERERRRRRERGNCELVQLRFLPRWALTKEKKRRGRSIPLFSRPSSSSQTPTQRRFCGLSRGVLERLQLFLKSKRGERAMHWTRGALEKELAHASQPLQRPRRRKKALRVVIGAPFHSLPSLPFPVVSRARSLTGS